MTAVLKINIESDAKAAARAVEDFAGKFDGVTKSAGKAERQMQETTGKADALGESFGNTSSASSQAAGGLGDLGGALSSLPGPLGKIGTGMETLAPAIMGVTGASDLLELATTKLKLAQAKQVVVSIAQKGATLAASAAQKVLAISTAALNVVMSANPIVLVVLAIAALVAGLVLAYQHSDTFRAIVQAAFGAVQVAVMAVVTFFTGTVVPFFTTTIPGAFTSMQAKIVGIANAVFAFFKTWGPVALAVLVPFIGIPLLIFQHFDQIKAYLATAFGNAKSTVSGWISDTVALVTGLPGKLSALAGNMLSAGKTLISNLGTGLLQGFTDVASGAAGIASAIFHDLVDFVNDHLISPLKNFKFTIGAFGVSHTFQPFGSIPTISAASGGAGSSLDGRVLFASSPNVEVHNYIDGQEFESTMVRVYNTQTRKLARKVANA